MRTFEPQSGVGGVRRAGRAWPRRGFTLVELLVAVSIILLLMGITFPVLSSMRDQSRVSAGINTVSVAVSAARSYLDRERTHNSDPLVRPNAEVPASPFKGIAALFTPSGEIRLLRFKPDARDGTDLLANNNRAGFEDIPNRSYIDIPNGVVIRGIGRNNTGTAGLQLLEPPFAIRFNEFGHLISRSAGTVHATRDDRVIIYDGNYDGSYDIDDDRGSYSIATYSLVWDSDETRYRVPFERIETVVGVRVIDEQYYDPTRPDLVVAGAPPQAFTDIMFSKYTGTPFRNQ